MPRRIMFLLLTLFTVLMLNSVALAGTIGSSPATTVKTLVNNVGSNQAELQIDTVLSATDFYTPSDIPLSAANNALVTLQLASGKFSINPSMLTGTGTLQICDDAGNAQAASYVQGSGTSSLVFTTGPQKNVILNGVKYHVGYTDGTTDCQPLPAGSIRVQGYIAGTTSYVLTIKIRSATIQSVFDTAIGTTAVTSVNSIP